MDALKIDGGAPLRGDIYISGSKNACLPLMIAAILGEGPSELKRVPDLVDVRTLSKILKHMGVQITQKLVKSAHPLDTAQPASTTLFIDPTTLTLPEAPYELVRTMRASFWVLGALLGRFGHAKVSLPGGCAIGARPVDEHLKALVKLGAEIRIEHGYVEATVKKGRRLMGAEIVFDMPTVGGTQNILLAAALAKGTTIINNAAKEPEVVEHARVLQKMGVEISGVGTNKLVIEGQERLAPYKHTLISDRIEFGTFLVAGALIGEELQIHHGVLSEQTALLAKLRAVGAQIDIVEANATGKLASKQTSVVVTRAAKPQSVDILTAPYPGFPTDMQAQMMVLLSLSQGGSSVIAESIFENRFMHVAELGRLGANIKVIDGQALVKGVPKLSGTTVMATDLRASACLVLAGLVAEGTTIIRRIYHLDRGYEHLETKLQQVGARITRFHEGPPTEPLLESYNHFSNETGKNDDE